MTDITRDQYGRPLIPNPIPDGKPVPHLRPSSVAIKIADRYNLERWAERTVAKGMGDRPDLVALAHSANPLEQAGKRTLDDVAKQAKDAARALQGANLGTALHAYVEQINLGEDVQPLAEHRPAVDAYRQLLDQHGIEVVESERFVVWPDKLIAGTRDIVARYNGRLVVMDLKTGQHNPTRYSMVEQAAQLACYANSTHTYNGTTFAELDECDLDHAYLIWCPSGGSEAHLIEVDIRKGAHWVGLALEVADAHKDKTAGRQIAVPSPSPTHTVAAAPQTPDDPFDQLTPQADTEEQAAMQVRSEWLHQAIRDATPATKALIAKDWPHGAPLPKEWGHRPPTTSQLVRIEHLYDQAAAETGEPLLPPPRTPDDRLRRHTAEHPDPSTRTDNTEGPRLTPEQHTELVDALTRLPAEHAEQLRQWAAEANQAGVTLNIRDGATTRQAAILHAATALAGLDDDSIRCALAAADQPGTPIGALLAKLSIDQAARLPIVLGFPGTKLVLDDPNSVDLVGRHPLQPGE